MQAFVNPMSQPTTVVNRSLVLLIFGLLCASPWLGGGTFLLWAMLGMLPIVIAVGDLLSVHLVLVFLMPGLVVRLAPTMPAAVLGKVGGMGLYLFVVVTIGGLRRSVKWARVGRVDLRSILLMVGIVVLSAMGVILWAHLAPQSAAIRGKILPTGVSARLLPVYMAGFAAINALIEEIIWRGVEMAALEAAFGVGVLALVLQAGQFGLAHYRGGFPNGWSGVGLTFLFGLAMGWLRGRTKGLVMPWIAHAVADFTIIWLVVHRVGM
jgi:membrane protease YdiL (CAAX protease family)